jgi:glycosyltransferase involved in cell wall biosynthesis
MLSQGRGLLAEFRNSKSIAECIEYVIDHPDKKEKMERKTYAKGRTMTWENVAEQYYELFTDVLKKKFNARDMVTV